MTLYDFGMEIQNIRSVANTIEVKGSENASKIIYIIGKCNDLISAINKVTEENNKQNQNGTEEKA